jgi:hypothetical protein
MGFSTSSSLHLQNNGDGPLNLRLLYDGRAGFDSTQGIEGRAGFVVDHFGLIACGGLPGCGPGIENELIFDH